jgi:hypothetical protein
MLLGCVAMFKTLSGDAIGAVASTNGSMTSRAQTSSATSVGTHIGYVDATSSAAATISSTVTAGHDYRVSISEWSGLSAASFDKSIDGTGSAATHASGNTATTTQANELVIVFDSHSAVDTATNAAASGYTKLVNASDESTTNMPAFVGYKSVSSTGAQSASVTWENGEYVCSVLTFKESGGGAAAPIQYVYAPRYQN